MVWSRDYLRDLLHGNDPVKSVSALDEIWCSRPNRNKNDPYFGLLPCQYAVHLYLNYVGEVGNGGHMQYFLNPVGACAHETLAALKELGFHEIHEILLRAIAIFPHSRVPKDWAERNSLVEGFSEESLEKWDQLDRELYEAESSTWAPLLKYLQEHESEILEEAKGDVTICSRP